MLKKLSLAALVAMGSMSVASASTDLSSAIKGVTIGGYLRYRLTEKNTKTSGNDQDTTIHTTTNEYKAVLNADIKASDTVTVHGRLVYKDAFTSNNNDAKETAKPFNVREAYLNYKANGANVKAGLQALATPLTDHDDDYANGVLATYSISGITGAAAYFNQLSNAGGQVTSQNVAVLAAIADIKPVKLQAWYYNVSDTNEDANNDGGDGYHAYFLEAAGNVDVVTLKAQYAARKDKNRNNTNKFGAVAAEANVANVNVTAAYLKFGTTGQVRVGTENADGLIAAGDVLTDIIQRGSLHVDETNKDLIVQNGYAYALVLKTKVGKFTPGIQYVYAKSDFDRATSQKETIKEYDLDLSYQYNKKLKFSGYYAYMKIDPDNIDSKIDYKEGRFEAKYSF